MTGGLCLSVLKIKVDLLARTASRSKLAACAGLHQPPAVFRLLASDPPPRQSVSERGALAKGRDALSGSP